MSKSRQLDTGKPGLVEKLFTSGCPLYTALCRIGLSTSSAHGVSSTVAQLAVFLDDGGVMNDNATRGLQWQRLVAEYLAPMLGGNPSDWREANRVVAEREFKMYKEHFWGHPEADYLSFREKRGEDWLRGMCEQVGVAAPSGDECVRVARETCAFVTRRVRSALPGAANAIRAFHSMGHRLYTASGEDSEDLDGYLEGMGVRDLFERLYGPDLVNAAKEGPHYYQRIFEDAVVRPNEAVVVDDSRLVHGWAKEIGATAVLVSADGAALNELDAVIRSLAELPQLLVRDGGVRDTP